MWLMVCLGPSAVNYEVAAFPAKKPHFLLFWLALCAKPRDSRGGGSKHDAYPRGGRRLACRNLVGVKRYCPLNMRAKSNVFRYPKSVAMAFTATFVVVSRSIAVNKRCFFAYCFTPSPVCRLKSRATVSGRNVQFQLLASTFQTAAHSSAAGVDSFDELGDSPVHTALLLSGERDWPVSPIDTAKTELTYEALREVDFLKNEKGQPVGEF